MYVSWGHEMAFVKDIKHGRYLLQVKRRDRLYGTDNRYRTSVSIDSDLMEFFACWFDGSVSRAADWIAENIECIESDGSAQQGQAKHGINPAMGFSRMVQRYMIQQMRSHCQIRPLGTEDRRGSRAAGKSRTPKARQSDGAHPENIDRPEKEKDSAGRKSGAREKSGFFISRPIDGQQF